MRSNKRLFISVPLFVAIQLVIYFLILGPIKINYSNHLCYLSIVISFLFGLIFFNLKKSLLSLSLFFILIADLFLVPRFIINGTPLFEQTWAMVFFNIAQFTLAIYIHFSSNILKHIPQLIIRLIIFIISIVLPFIVLKDKADFLSVISVVYFGTFICNLLFSLFNFKKNPLFAIGLAFYFLCDIVTGLCSAYEGGYLLIDTSSWLYKNILFGSINFIWLFYIPGISLICLSIPNYKRLFR